MGRQVVTLGDLASDEFQSLILDPSDSHRGWIDKTRIWPQPVDGADGADGLTGLASLTAQVSISNSAAETQVLVATLPANLMAAGTTFRLKARGAISTAAMVPGAATWRARMGPTTMTGGVACTVAIAALTSSMVAQAWQCEMDVTIRTAGGSGTMLGMGAAAGLLGAAGVYLWSPSTATYAAAVDTTVQNLLELTFQFGTADPGTVLIIDHAILELVLRDSIR